MDTLNLLPMLDQVWLDARTWTGPRPAIARPRPCPRPRPHLDESLPTGVKIFSKLDWTPMSLNAARHTNDAPSVAMKFCPCPVHSLCRVG